MKKKMNRILGIMLVSLLFVFSSVQKGSAQDVTVSFQSFYDNLSPYGQWVSDPQYGNVWVPNEGGDFRPYGSRGRWAMTDYGNTWVSDDPWGWACYHYGRWTYNNYYGWVWIPGYEWAPAWVSWRYGGGYSGWAPMGPGMSVGMSFNGPDSWWIFVQPQYMYVNNCYSYWRGPQYNRTYINQTTIINNYYVDNNTRVRYNYGPRADVIQRDTRQPVQVYRVSQLNRPGAPRIENDRVNIYRPTVNRETRGTSRPTNVIQAPRQIGRPEAATNVTPGRQPEFRQQTIRQNGGNAEPGNRTQPQQQGREQVQPGNRTEPQPNRQQVQPGNRVQPQDRTQMPQDRTRQQQSRPETEPNNRQQPMNRQQQAPQPMQRPDQGRFQQAPQPQNKPEPMQRPDQGRFQQAPQPQTGRNL